MKIKLLVELDDMFEDREPHMYYFRVGVNQYRMYEMWFDTCEMLPGMTNRFKKIIPNEN
jgi:hypothetical protein